MEEDDLGWNDAIEQNKIKESSANLPTTVIKYIGQEHIYRCFARLSLHCRPHSPDSDVVMTMKFNLIRANRFSNSAEDSMSL